MPWARVNLIGSNCHACRLLSLSTLIIPWIFFALEISAFAYSIQWVSKKVVTWYFFTQRVEDYLSIYLAVFLSPSARPRGFVLSFFFFIFHSFPAVQSKCSFGESILRIFSSGSHVFKFFIFNHLWSELVFPPANPCREPQHDFAWAEVGQSQ